MALHKPTNNKKVIYIQSSLKYTDEIRQDVCLGKGDDGELVWYHIPCNTSPLTVDWIKKDDLVLFYKHENASWRIMSDDLSAIKCVRRWDKDAKEVEEVYVPKCVIVELNKNAVIRQTDDK